MARRAMAKKRGAMTANREPRRRWQRTADRIAAPAAVNKARAGKFFWPRRPAIINPRSDQDPRPYWITTVETWRCALSVQPATDAGVGASTRSQNLFRP